MLFLESVVASSKDEMVAFLKTYEEYTLFLLGNLETYGMHLTQEPYSGNYKIIRKGEEIIAVFSLTKSGTLLIHSKEATTPFFHLVLRACREEPIQIKGLIGKWDFCHLFWNLIKAEKIIVNETYASKEILYSTELSLLNFEKQPDARLLLSTDWEQWYPLRAAYIQEMHFPSQGSKEDIFEEFQLKVEQKISWGLFSNGKLIAIADLNAKAFDLGQVGGVYTLPAFRKQGHCTTLMRHLIHDAKNLHHLRKLIIFTSETNHSARKVYESLGVTPFGHYALLFG